MIKAIAADALGMHLDLFQRINVEPCSLTVVRYHGTRPSVLRLNDLGGDVSALIRAWNRRPRRARRGTRPWAAARAPDAGDPLYGKPTKPSADCASSTLGRPGTCA